MTTACTPGCGLPTGAGSTSGSAPTRSSSVLTLRSTFGVPDAVSKMPPMFTAQRTARPPASIFQIFGRLRTAATAISGTAANPAAISVSHRKYRSQPDASCWLSVSSTFCGPSLRSICTTCGSIVMWSSASRGLIGPVNCGLVAITWPNRSSSPGPCTLAFGRVAPTWAVCPAAETVCSGVMRSASQMAPAVMMRNVRM